MNSDLSIVLKLSQRSDVMSSKVLMEENVIEALDKESLIDDAPAVSEEAIQNNQKPTPSSGSNMQLFDDKEVNAAAEQGNNDVSQGSDTEPAVNALLNEAAKQQAAAPTSKIQAGDITTTAASEPHTMHVALQKTAPGEVESTKFVTNPHTNSEDDNTSCIKSPAASTHGKTTPLTSVAGDGSVKSGDDNKEQQRRLLKKAEKQKATNAPPCNSNVQPSFYQILFNATSETKVITRRSKISLS